jgi:predicted  nucleic acid-binding Zn-ribbon protein
MSSFQLFRLQQIDLRLDHAQSRIKQIDEILGDDSDLIKAQSFVDSTKQILAEARKQTRNAEMDVRSQNIKIEQTEAALYGGKVRNPKELQDLTNEAAALKRYLNILEDRQLEAMFKEEEAEANYQKASSQLEDLISRRNQEHKKISAEKAALLNDVANLTDEREAAIKSISKEELSLYEQLREQRRGIAVAKVSGKNCSACGSTLSTSLLYAAHSPNKISLCETCGRILYAG